MNSKNDKLSLRAVGLLSLFKKAGRVIPTNELRDQYAEGRDAILTAKAELKARGYIRMEKVQINGQWTTYSHFVDLDAKPKWTDPGYSGPLRV
jgi:hypothetical protein